MSNEVKIEVGTIVRYQTLYGEEFGLIKKIHTYENGSQEIAINCPVRAYGRVKDHFYSVREIFPSEQTWKGWTIADPNSYHRAFEQFANPEDFQEEIDCPYDTAEMIRANID